MESRSAVGQRGRCCCWSPPEGTRYQQIRYRLRRQTWAMLLAAVRRPGETAGDIVAEQTLRGSFVD